MMSKTVAMDKQEIIELLIKGQYYFMFAVCTVFGVISNESYLILKHPDRPKWKNFIPKVCLAFFVCILVHAAYEYKDLNPEFEYAPIIAASYLHYPLGKWIITSLFPLLTKLLIGSIKSKEDE